MQGCRAKHWICVVFLISVQRMRDWGVLRPKWDICIITSLAAAYVPSGCDGLHKTKIRQHPSTGWGVEVTEFR